MIDALKGRGLSWEDMVVEQEPSPGLVDQAVRVYRHAGIEIVLGIGGGSVLDAAKAIAGLLPHGNSVMDHLEGVGPELPYQGPSLPFIAVPTTAGTGSEATKNAVLSMHGPDGFKKSFRHDLLVARYAVVDPALLATCPPDLIAANGMDALTQLLESYVSTRANPFVDALALSGLGYVRDGLLDWYEGGEKAAEGRAGMAYAALLSGITLAQVGLGSVHGLAAPLGGDLSGAAWRGLRRHRGGGDGNQYPCTGRARPGQSGAGEIRQNRPPDRWQGAPGRCRRAGVPGANPQGMDGKNAGAAAERLWHP